MILSDFLLPVIEYEISKIEEEGYRPAIYLSPRNAIELTLSINPYLCITEYSKDEENYPEQECGRIGTYKGAYVFVTKDIGEQIVIMKYINGNEEELLNE